MDNKNLPAFPILCAATENGIYLNTAANIQDDRQVTGLSKREYFAAMALQGMLANPEWTKIDAHVLQSDSMAVGAVRAADALLSTLKNSAK